MYRLCTGQMHLSAFHNILMSLCVLLVVCFCTESLPDSTANVQPAAEFVFLLLISSWRWGGIWGETAVYHSAAHDAYILLSDGYSGFYNGLARVSDKLVHLQAVRVLTDDKMFLWTTGDFVTWKETNNTSSAHSGSEHCDQDMILLMTFNCECNFFNAIFTFIYLQSLNLILSLNTRSSAYFFCCEWRVPNFT